MIVDNWPLVHTYMDGVRAEAVPPVLCPNDDTKLVLTVYKDKEMSPTLKCSYCGTKFLIGQDVLVQMRRNLREILELS